MDLLVVASRALYPPRRDGVAIRYFPILRELSRRHGIHLLLIGNEWEEESLAGMGEITCGIDIVKLAPIRFRWAKRLYYGLRYAVSWARPWALYDYHEQSIRQEIARIYHGRTFDAVVVVGPKYAYLADHQQGRDLAGRYIIDLIDSPGLIHERRRDSLFQHMDWLKWRRWEADLAKRVDELVYVSMADAAYAGERPNKRVIPNGLYTDDYLAGGDEAKRWTVAFLGNMSYAPNVQAANWLYEHVLLPLRAADRELSMVIIGRDPAPSIQRLGAHDGVTVTGSVEGIWPYLHASEIAVFPMFSGAGLQNKALEAMRAGVPVVTTPICNAGIGAAVGKEILVCETAGEFQEAVRMLLGDRRRRERIGKAGQAFVHRTFDWQAIIPRYEQILLGTKDVPPTARRSAGRVRTAK